MAYLHQENVGVDALIDKLLVSDMEHEDIASLLNIVFANHDYTEQEVKERADRVAKYKIQLDALLLLPKIEQRTPDWYATRQGLITASDFAQALGEGKFGTKEQLLKKKCGYEEDKFNASAAPLKWGTMFEPVASDIYTMRNNMKLLEFGLLKHPTIDYFGASPDGVNECGIMVEIKCPFRRKIDGTVPLQYYYQIQGQLDVCDLDECDYFESEFTAFDTVEELKEAGAKFEVGAIIEYPDYVYTYSPVKLAAAWNTTKLNTWVNKKKVELGDETKAKAIFYKLDKCNTIRVYKDPNFLTEKLEMLSVVWEKIKEYRADEELYNREIKKAADTVSPYKLKGWAFD